MDLRKIKKLMELLEESGIAEIEVKANRDEEHKNKESNQNEKKHNEEEFVKIIQNIKDKKSSIAKETILLNALKKDTKKLAIDDIKSKPLTTKYNSPKIQNNPTKYDSPKIQKNLPKIQKNEYLEKNNKKKNATATCRNFFL